MPSTGLAAERISSWFSSTDSPRFRMFKNTAMRTP